MNLSLKILIAVTFLILYAFNTVYGVSMSILLPLFGVGAVLAISSIVTKVNESIMKFILIVSSASYTIYLFHTTFEGFAKAILMKIMGKNIVNNDSYFLISSLVIVLFGCIMPIILHNCFKKNKYLSFAFGIKR